jgi:hypothetical protein
VSHSGQGGTFSDGNELVERQGAAGSGRGNTGGRAVRGLDGSYDVT